MRKLSLLQPYFLIHSLLYQNTRSTYHSSHWYPQLLVHPHQEGQNLMARNLLQHDLLDGW
jgi:hypothetical protein